MTRAAKNATDYWFDVRHGTRTRGIVQLETLNIASARKADGQFYVATPRYEFTHMMKRIGVDPKAYVFIDLGCGMGRVLLYAAEAGFRRVIGVEFSPDLAAVARRNAARFSAGDGSEIHVVTADAAEFSFPPQPCIIFLFNPFSSAVMKTVLARIKQVYDAGNRDIYLIWYNVTTNTQPLFDAVWLETICAESGDTARNSLAWICNFKLPYAIFRARVG